MTKITTRTTGISDQRKVWVGSFFGNFFTLCALLMYPTLSSGGAWSTLHHGSGIRHQVIAMPAEYCWWLSFKLAVD